MDILMFFLFSVIGYLVSAFGITTILLVLFVSFPLIKYYSAHKYLKNPDIAVKRSMITLLLWTVIVGTISFFIFAYASTASIIGYIVSIVFVQIIGRKRLGINEDNTRDFVNAHENEFDMDVLKDELEGPDLGEENPE